MYENYIATILGLAQQSVNYSFQQLIPLCQVVIVIY